MNILNVENSLLAIFLLPLFTAVISALFFRKCRWTAPILSTLSAFVCMGLALFAIINAGSVDFALTKSAFEIFKMGDFAMSISFSLDSLSMNMLFVVTFIGFLIHVFSLGYMDDDKARGRFFAGLSFFMFSITGIVFATNLFMMFIFWEFVGFSSYALIAHYSNTEAALKASKKAFIVNRIGDFGFILGIIMCYYMYGTTDFAVLGERLSSGAVMASTCVGLLLTCGFIGKSAQFPLQVWLSDAMAGPTPVSALIHAATMVAAGVFLMAKLSLIGMMTSTALDVVLIITAPMACLAGIWALGQKDIKKTLAYSTLSHLGLMGVAIGLGLYEIAMLHLTTHAFFKATLFLCAGSVIHACHHEQDMFKLGGLFKKMPITAITAGLATLSIMAMPFFAGFYSKDAIISGFYMRAMTEFSAMNWLGLALVFSTVILTPLYMGRFYTLVFLTKPRSANVEHAHESSWLMTLPLIILAFYSVAAVWGITYGFLQIIPENAQSLIASGLHNLHEKLETVAGIHAFEYTCSALAILTLVLVYFLYGKGTDTFLNKAPKLYGEVEKHGYFDIVYDFYVRKIQQRAIELINVLDLLIIEGLIIRGSSAIIVLFSYPIKALYLAKTQTSLWLMLGGIALIIGILLY